MEHGPFKPAIMILDPIRASPYRPVALNQPHHEAGQMTAPDHMPRCVPRTACTNGGVHRCSTRSGRAVRSRRRKIAPRMAPCLFGTGWGMYGVELYAAVRLAVVEEGLSHHEAGRRFGIDRRTVKKMLSYSSPPGYRRSKPVRRPKLEEFTGIVDAILEADADLDVPRKQRHSAHRIFERLRDEHGFPASGERSSCLRSGATARSLWSTRS